MILALAGNQNCGKTTLFNQLTGSNQHVGNFPGVTVEQKSGQVRGQKNCTVVDLPGIYSLRPYTAEEIVTRDYILRQKPDGIINIVDATNIERNLYLTLQLLELRVPRAAFFIADLAYFLVDRHARKVAHVLIGAGEGIEECRFAAVLVADESKDHFSSPSTSIFCASSTRSVSS